MGAAIFVDSSLLCATPMFHTFEIPHSPLIDHHIACPCDCRVHPPHTSSYRTVPVTKVRRKARMVHRGGRCANTMDSSGMLGWEADVLLTLTMRWWLGWHHTASCGRQMCLLRMSTLPHPRAWPLLIKVGSDIMSLPFLSDSSFGAQDYFSFLGGPNAAIGQVFIG